MGQEEKVTIIRDGIRRQVTPTALKLMGDGMEGHEIVKKGSVPKEVAKHVAKAEVKEEVIQKTPAQKKAEKQAAEAEQKELDKKIADETKDKYNQLIEAAKAAETSEDKYLLFVEAHELLPSKFTEKSIADLKEELKID